jgi:glycosyltransferase involved in cell wall biosynthesis
MIEQKRILYINPNIPYGFNISGGSSVVTSRIYSLAKNFSFVQSLRIVTGEGPITRSNYDLSKEHKEISDINKRKFEEIQNREIVVRLAVSVNENNTGIYERIKIFKNPELCNNPLFNERNKQIIEEIVQQINPDVIICEHVMPAMLINYINIKVPWIYCHHDWLYKIDSIRRNDKTLKWRFRNYLAKKAELNLVKNASGVICLSEFEKREIAKSNLKCIVQHVTYPKFDKSLLEEESISLVHFGGLDATANRLGIESFFSNSWFEIKKRFPRLKIKIIGNVDRALENTREAIEKDTNVVALGHCENLSEVLLPMDIQIIPWEYPTGSRTRVPIGLHFGQILLATNNAVSGFMELENMSNCIIVNSIDQFPDAVENILCNIDRMKIISQNAIEKFNDSFYLENSYSNLASFVNGIGF